jgi:predicted transcriptional regulator
MISLFRNLFAILRAKQQYDLKKFRAKGLVEKKPNSLRYMLTENGIRSIVAFQILREKSHRTVT